jgi:hypothetical protein
MSVGGQKLRIMKKGTLFGRCQLNVVVGQTCKNYPMIIPKVANHEDLAPGKFTAIRYINHSQQLKLA